MTPTLRIVRGTPTDEEVAALVTALTTVSAATEPPAPRPRSRWSHRASLVRSPIHPGPGAWRASAW